MIGVLTQTLEPELSPLRSGPYRAPVERLPLRYRAYRPVHHLLTRAGAVVVADRHPGLVVRNRLSAALYRRVLRAAEVTMVRTSDGFDIAVELDDLAAAEMVFEGCYAPTEARVLEVLLADSDYFVDVGANYGYFSLLAAARRGAGISVIAVEPNPTLAELIGRSIEHNGFPNVAVRQVAVGRTHGRARLRIDPRASATSALVNEADGRDPGDGEGVAVEVDVTTIDELLVARSPGQRVTLKVDVEGHEGSVIEGAQQVLGDGAALACEVFVSWAGSLLTRMEGIGYSAFRHDGEPISDVDFDRHRRLDVVFLPAGRRPAWK